ncbi:MAG: helix-turn-helix transcriptional regulator [Anaerolineales bacterium]|nr:helix-turn-helix transcriptional regulator [Anaerolineales bacterium]
MIQLLQGLADQEELSIEEISLKLLHRAIKDYQIDERLLHSWESLSPREQQIASLLCLGYTNQQIAGQLIISPETVKTHVRNTLQKFNVKTRYDLKLALANWDFSEWDHPSSR